MGISQTFWHLTSNCNYDVFAACYCNFSNHILLILVRTIQNFVRGHSMVFTFIIFCHTCSWYICEATASSRKRTYDHYHYFLSLTGLVKGMLPQNKNTNFSTSHASRMPYQHPLTVPCGTARSLHGYFAKVLRENQPVL